MVWLHYDSTQKAILRYMSATGGLVLRQVWLAAGNDVSGCLRSGHTDMAMAGWQQHATTHTLLTAPTGPWLTESNDEFELLVGPGQQYLYWHRSAFFTNVIEFCSQSCEMYFMFSIISRTKIARVVDMHASVGKQGAISSYKCNSIAAYTLATQGTRVSAAWYWPNYPGIICFQNWKD